MDYGLTISCYDPDDRGRSCGHCDSACTGKKALKPPHSRPHPLLLTVRVSKPRLRQMAAATWYTGSLVLGLKSLALIMAAHALRPGGIWPWTAAAAGLALGSLRARSIFTTACQKTWQGSTGLKTPKAWQFFRPGFFFLLVLMICAGALLSRLATGHYPCLLGAAVLNLSIGTALFISGREFCARPGND